MNADLSAEALAKADERRSGQEGLTQRPQRRRDEQAIRVNTETGNLTTETTELAETRGWNHRCTRMNTDAKKRVHPQIAQTHADSEHPGSSTQNGNRR